MGNKLTNVNRCVLHTLNRNITHSVVISREAIKKTLNLKALFPLTHLQNFTCKFVDHFVRLLWKVTCRLIRPCLKSRTGKKTFLRMLMITRSKICENFFYRISEMSNTLARSEILPGYDPFREPVIFWKHLNLSLFDKLKNI